MNIREELLVDKNQSRSLMLRVASFACTAPENFSTLVECLTADDFRLAKRAAWSVSWAAQMNPEMVFPHIGTLVRQLKRTDVHDAIIRSSVRILQKITIPEEFHGEVLDACFDFIQNRKTPIAIKAFSLTILYNFSKIYPDIKKELRIIIEENMEFESAAFRARGKKILAKI